MNAKTFRVARGSAPLGDYTRAQIRDFLASGTLHLDDLFWNPAANDWRPLSEWEAEKMSPRSFSKLKELVGKHEHAPLILLAVVLLVASWLFPPWIHYNPHRPPSRSYGSSSYLSYGTYYSARHPHGWFFLFDTTQGETKPASLVMRVDFGRLLLLDAVIAMVIACAILGASRWQVKPWKVAAGILGTGLAIALLGAGWNVWQAHLEQERLAELAKVESAKAEQTGITENARAEQQRAADAARIEQMRIEQMRIANEAKIQDSRATMAYIEAEKEKERKRDEAAVEQERKRQQAESEAREAARKADEARQAENERKEALIVSPANLGYIEVQCRYQHSSINGIVINRLNRDVETAIIEIQVIDVIERFPIDTMRVEVTGVARNKPVAFKAHSSELLRPNLMGAVAGKAISAKFVDETSP